MQKISLSKKNLRLRRERGTGRLNKHTMRKRYKYMPTFSIRKQHI